MVCYSLHIHSHIFICIAHLGQKGRLQDIWQYVAGTALVHCVIYQRELLYGKTIIYRHEISETPKKPQHNTVKITVKIYFLTLTMTVKLMELRNLIRLSACAVWHCLMFCGIAGPAIKLLQALVRANQFTSIHMNSTMTGYTIKMWS